MRHGIVRRMSENRATIAALVVGLLIGAVVGLAIGAMLQITSDQWWALAGSAVGAVLAIFGAVLVFPLSKPRGRASGSPKHRPTN